MYKEGEKLYTNFPSWVEGSLNLGYHWVGLSNNTAKRRRIALVSMPCQSVAAPLVALGLLRRELELEDTNFFNRYFEYLLNEISVRQEKSEQIILVDDNNKKWNLIQVNQGHSIKVCYSKYKESVKRRGRRIPNPNGQVVSTIMSSNARYWRLDGQPRLWCSEPLDYTIYKYLIRNGGDIYEHNLQNYWRETVLLSNFVGKDSFFHKRISSIKFCFDEEEVGLDTLLTVNGVSPQITRVTLHSANELNSLNYSPKRVVVEGSLAFLKALEHFRESDIIGVISRDEPSSNLEQVMEKNHELSRYYQTKDSEDLTATFPVSIITHLMERR